MGKFTNLFKSKNRQLGINQAGNQAGSQPAVAGGSMPPNTNYYPPAAVGPSTANTAQPYQTSGHQASVTSYQRTQAPGVPQVEEAPEAFTWHIREELWREMAPGTEHATGATGSFQLDFAGGPEKQWTRGGPFQPGQLGRASFPRARETPDPRRIVPRLLFDLITGRVVDGAGLGNAHYLVISHVWGDARPSSGAKYGVQWDVPLNHPQKLDMVLESARVLGGFRFVWIDVLCIDQRSATVAEAPAMQDYLANSGGCLVWLDRSDNPAEWAGVLDALKYTNGIFKLDEHGYPTYGVEQLNSGEDLFKLNLSGDECMKMITRVKKIEKAPWFQRVWTLQEGVIPQDFLMCTPERYMISSGTLFQVITILGTLAATLSDAGTMPGFVIQHRLQYSEIWKILRLRQLYRKRQINYFHINSALKTRQSRRPQDRIFGVLGLVPKDQQGGYSTELTYDKPLEYHQDALFRQYIARSNFGSLLFCQPLPATPHKRDNPFLLSAVHAEERQESHRFTPTAEGLFLQDVGIEPVTKIWCAFGSGNMTEWWRQYTPLANISKEQALDYISAFELPMQKHNPDIHFMAILAINNMGDLSKMQELLSKTEDIANMLQDIQPHVYAMWTNIMTVLFTRPDFAVLLLWTGANTAKLAVITEAPPPGSSLVLVTPSSFVNKPGEGFLVCAETAPGSWKFRKIGLGVSASVKASFTENIILLNGM